MVTDLKLHWGAESIPEIELRIFTEKLDISGKIKDLKTIKLVEQIEGV